MKTNKEFLEELKITHKENSSFLFFLDFYTSNPTPLKPIFSAPNCYDIKAIVEDFVSNSKVKIDDSEKKYLLRCLKYKDANKYKNNEYLNLLDKVSYNKKKLNILDWVINPYEIFISGDSYLQFDKNQYFIPLSFTDKELRFKKIFFNKFTQFNISPLEIESMKLPLKIIKGNVLILGLREGYFAYMASLNKIVQTRN